MHALILMGILIFCGILHSIRHIRINKTFLMIIGVTECFLLSIILYVSFTMSSHMYVNEIAVEQLISETPLENTETFSNKQSSKISQTEIEFSDIPFWNLKKIIKFLFNNRDILAFILGIIAIPFIAYLILYRSYINPYCKKLEKSLYNLNHMWLRGQFLDNLLISINIWEGASYKEKEVCDYFKNELFFSVPGKYLILGNPGEGKTVSIRKLADMILTERKLRSYNYIKELIINFIPILGNKFKTKEQKIFIPIIFNIVDIKNIRKPDDFKEEVKRHIYSVAKSKNIFNSFEKIKRHIDKTIINKLRQGELVFLFDGLDEINGENRWELAKVILQFIDDYPKCYYIFSSRTTLLEETSFLRFDSKKSVKLVPFTKEKILLFLTKWNFSEGKSYWDLYEKILYNYQLERLAHNPLLLTLITYLYDNSDLFLPNNTVEFYKEAIRCLLEKWEQEKRILKRTHIPYEIKCIFLEEISYWLFSCDETCFSRIDAHKATKSILEYGYTQDMVFNEIYSYSGIIEKTRDDNYKFYHRSFWEYFLACYIYKNKINIYSNPKFEKYSHVMLFYLTLLDHPQVTEKFILSNHHNLNIIDSIILECTVKDKKLIQVHLSRKLRQKPINIEEYYLSLGWIAEKYEYVKTRIYKFLILQLEECVKEERANEISFILQTLSSFLCPTESAKIFLKYIDRIEFLDFIINSNVQMAPCIIALFFTEISLKRKQELLLGLCEAGKYSTILEILVQSNKQQEKNLIFNCFLHQTKNSNFIQWYDKQNINQYLNKDELQIIQEWEKDYGWKWEKNSLDLRQKRFALVYFLLKTENEFNLDLTKISNRIKFVATYIKNMQQTNVSTLYAYFIDIPDYKVISPIEFKYHWKKTKMSEKIAFDPAIIKLIQWIVSFGILFLFLIVYLKYQNDALIFKENTTHLFLQLCEENVEMFNKISRLIELDTLYNYEISNYIGVNLHMFIFYILWSYCLMKAYKEFFENPFNYRYIFLYFEICSLFYLCFTVIFSDIFLRIGGGIIVLITFIFAIIQHWHNMPSFQDPQYSIIKNYLFNDKF